MMLPTDVLELLGRDVALDTKQDMLGTLQAFGGDAMESVLNDPRFVASWLTAYVAREDLHVKVLQVPSDTRTETTRIMAKALLAGSSESDVDFDIDNILANAVAWLPVEVLSDVLGAKTDVVLSWDYTIKAAAMAGRSDIVARLMDYAYGDKYHYDRAREFALSGAITRNDAAMVKVILDSGYDCSIQNDAENDPIWLLFLDGPPNLDILKRVVAAGAAIPDFMDDPLYDAIVSKNEAALMLLARARYANEHFGADLEYAWAAGMMDAVHLMLSMGAPISRALECAVCDNDMALLRFMCANRRAPIACSALSAACRMGTLEAIEVLIANGADPGQIEEQFFFDYAPLKTAWEEAELHSPQCHEYLRRAVAEL